VADCRLSEQAVVNRSWQPLTTTLEYIHKLQNTSHPIIVLTSVTANIISKLPEKCF